MAPVNQEGFTLAVRALLECGIGQTKANEIIRSGLLPTFTIGRNRYVRRADLATLPEKFKEPGAAAQLEAARYRRKTGRTA